jgi:hypothetical protein
MYHSCFIRNCSGKPCLKVAWWSTSGVVVQCWGNHHPHSSTGQRFVAPQLQVHRNSVSSRYHGIELAGPHGGTGKAPCLTAS